MKVLFDSNVIIAALIETHPQHSSAWPWLQKARRKDIEAMIAAHSLAEIYATLTKLPVYPRISPALAEKLIARNVLPHFQIITADQNDYRTVLQILAKNNIAGGATYDALIAHAAAKAQADKLLTFNSRDFKKAYPAVAKLIEVPH